MIINPAGPRLVLAALLALALATPVALWGQHDDVATARRIADVTAIAVAEYGAGVQHGRVVQPAELEEARLFLAEARRSADGLGPTARGSVLPLLDRMIAQVAELAPLVAVETALGELREVLGRAVGAPLDPLPRTAPSLARGAELYARACAQCHGDGGRGDGPLAARLEPPPPDLTDSTLRATSPLEFFRKINVGVAGTAMPAFGDQLSLDERWALALYAATLRHSAEARDRGRERLRVRCAGCVVLVSGFDATAALSDTQLDSLLAATAAPAIAPADRSDLVAYARAAGAVEELGADRSLEGARTVARSEMLADEAVRMAASGDGEAAARRALDAYLVFEGIERTTRARDPRAAARVERAFADFRMAVATGDPAQVGQTRGEVAAALDAAAASLAAGRSPASLFGQSLVIMVREGVEAILIIGALVAFLTKAGVSERKRDIGVGVLAALAASGVTAAALATLFRRAAAHQELLEGLTMLAAAFVLFWVSYWLISKIEARKWQDFVRGQMQRALATRRSLALAAVAFLAVYREGFETVLFYGALFSTAGGAAGATTGVVAGIVLGAAMLVAIYLGISRYGVRLPLRPFFTVTSTLLYVMAFSFAGQGVAELQEAGLISTTPLSWLPDVPMLGIFPTMQTLAVQLVLAAACLMAIVWLFWWQPRVARRTASG